MLLVRIGTRSRWDRGDVDQAARDLTLRDHEDGLSVYRVADAQEAQAIARCWAVEKRDRDDHLDYVLFDEQLVVGSHDLCRREDEHAEDPRLRAMHCELKELCQTAAHDLAQKIMNDPQKQVHRISKQDVALARAQRGASEG